MSHATQIQLVARYWPESSAGKMRRQFACAAKLVQFPLIGCTEECNDQNKTATNAHSREHMRSNDSNRVSRSRQSTAKRGNLAAFFLSLLVNRIPGTSALKRELERANQSVVWFGCMRCHAHSGRLEATRFPPAGPQIPFDVAESEAACASVFASRVARYYNDCSS